MLLTFAQWHAPERIAKLASLAVAHRGKDDGRTLREAAQQLRDRFGADVVLVENDFLPYSSTIARAMLAFRCGEDYLEPAVYDAVCMQGFITRAATCAPCRSMRWPASPLPLHDPKRVPHVLGCSHTAAELAARFGEDPPARRAGLLHDVTKALPGPEQLKLCDKYGMMLDTFERSHPEAAARQKRRGGRGGRVRGICCGAVGYLLAHDRQAGHDAAAEDPVSCRLHGAEPGFPRRGTAPRSGAA